MYIGWHKFLLERSQITSGNRTSSEPDNNDIVPLSQVGSFYQAPGDSYDDDIEPQFGYDGGQLPDYGDPDATRGGRLDGGFRGPITIDETNDEDPDICPGCRHTGPVLYIDLVSEVGSHHSEDVQVVYRADYETVYQVSITTAYFPHLFTFLLVFFINVLPFTIFSLLFSSSSDYDLFGFFLLI